VSSNQVGLSHPKYRADIDGLRAIAVLSVLVFHAFPEWLSGGFIGVDVFFIISGYLISTIVFENINKQRFSFLEFYSRRINRIFPALFVVLIFSYGFGWLHLLADDFAQLGKHIAGGAGFISNLVLWSESGYFDKAAELKPLLHLWSLGIEEQFYFVWPLAIWFISRWPKKVLPFILAITFISFGLNVFYTNTNPVATFYSPFTRFWELLIGSLLAYITVYRLPVLHAIQAKYQSIFSSLGLVLILAGAFILNQKSSFPGWWALMPTAGSALVIGAGTNAWCNQKILSNKVLVWFGLISFPLYLWHWPLLAFARLQEGETPSLMVRIGLVLASITLAWLTYRFIEKPIRFNASYRIHKNITLIFLMILIGYLGYNCFDRKGIAFRHKFFMKEISGYTFDKVAEQRQRTCFLMDISDDVNNFSTKCIHDDRPYKLVLWGDSHGGSIYPGFSDLERNNPKISVTQFTAAGCGGLVPTEEQGPFCQRANEVALREILKLKPNLVVVYKAWHPHYFEQIAPTVAILKKENIQLLIIGPTPRWKDDLPKVIYRYWKKHKELPPPYYGESLETDIRQMDLDMRKVAKENHILYYSAYDRLCNADGCLNRIPNTDNALTTLDEDHITPAAGRHIVEGLKRDVLSTLVK
jgi:peptidoglycan/LPS O-acetylase OafA/YrhL